LVVLSSVGIHPALVKTKEETMPRTARTHISSQEGSIHIISRINRENTRFDAIEKETLFNLLNLFASGFYVQIHAYCIMGTHFHILASSLDQQAQHASREELLHRYRLMYGKKATPPTGSYQNDGTFSPDEDGGFERLRRRLGSISRFVQELKQTFSVWYNQKHQTRGYLWHDRFKGIILDIGQAQLLCSSYIDLNPVRAGLVERPEDYRWSSIGLRARDSKLYGALLIPVVDDVCWYREFVYVSGGIERQGTERIADGLIADVIRVNGELGVGDGLRYRMRNLSEGLAIGTHGFIATLQRRLNRKFIRPRAFLKANLLFSTRLLRSDQ
jgi:REP element-mobilizing transposase RayT